MRLPLLEHSHEPNDIAKRLDAGPRVSYLRDWVYGGIDGAVTTFAIVAGSTGANLSTKIILILGIANLLADGFSMAAANYSGTTSENENYDRLLAIEEKHIELDPAGEREEIRQIFFKKGFSGRSLDQLVDLISSNRTAWIETMMQAEYGLSASHRSPLKAGFYTFSAFGIFGAIPLAPFLFAATSNALFVSLLTTLAFFAIGSLRASWSPRHWLACGLETTAIGTTAAAIAYVSGHWLQSVFS